jgi:hypothetical protein
LQPVALSRLLDLKLAACTPSAAASEGEGFQFSELAVQNWPETGLQRQREKKASNLERVVELLDYGGRP